MSATRGQLRIEIVFKGEGKKVENVRKRFFSRLIITTAPQTKAKTF